MRCGRARHGTRWRPIVRGCGAARGRHRATRRAGRQLRRKRTAGLLWHLPPLGRRARHRALRVRVSRVRCGRVTARRRGGTRLRGVRGRRQRPRVGVGSRVDRRRSGPVRLLDRLGTVWAGRLLCGRRTVRGRVRVGSGRSDRRRFRRLRRPVARVRARFDSARRRSGWGCRYSRWGCRRPALRGARRWLGNGWLGRIARG